MDTIVALSEIVAAVAVVVSLLYVAAQIKQSNRQSATEAGYAWASESNRFLEWICEADIAGVLIKLRGEAELSPIEALRAEAFAERLLNAWWVGETSFKNGIMDCETHVTVAELKIFAPIFRND